MMSLWSQKKIVYNLWEFVADFDHEFHKLHESFFLC